MADRWSELRDNLAGFAGKWTAYAAFGTFLVYLLGYLTLRFQLSTYGVVADLDAFDEKYLFAGNRFLVYLVASVPNVLLIVGVLAVAVYLPYRLIRPSTTARIARWGATWIARPAVVPLFGTVLALALIQLVLRRCFVLGNVLLAPKLPEYEWIDGILLGDDTDRSLFFSGLVVSLLLTAGLLGVARRPSARTTTLSRILTALLVFLVAVELLLLPVNYGILIASQELPRVSEQGNAVTSTKGDQIWLVWQSKETLTYLVRAPSENRRALVTIPRKDTRITIVAYENIFRVLFAPSALSPQEGGLR